MKKVIKELLNYHHYHILKMMKYSDPHLNFEELLNKNDGVAIFSGTINGLFGQLFDKGKFKEIKELYSKLKSKLW